MTMLELIRHHRRAVNEHTRELDNAADEMLETIMPRLQRMSRWRLRDLKRALRRFNARTGEWS